MVGVYGVYGACQPKHESVCVCVLYRFPLTLLVLLCSDPYTRLSLYDPVTGELVSLQTKTIKKVRADLYSHAETTFSPCSPLSR